MHGTLKQPKQNGARKTQIGLDLALWTNWAQISAAYGLYDFAYAILPSWTRFLKIYMGTLPVLNHWFLLIFAVLMPNLSSAAWKLGTLMVPFHAAAKGSETGLGNKQHIWIMKRKKVTCLDSPETAAMWGTPSVAAPGPVKGHFLPRSALQSLLFVPRKCGGAGSGEIGARPDFLCGPAAPRAARPSGTLRGRELHVQPLRAGPRSYWAPSATPLSPALPSRPLQPAPSQPGFQRKEDASLPRRFRINRVTSGSRTGARTPRLDRGGAWWGGRGI